MRGLFTAVLLTLLGFFASVVCGQEPAATEPANSPQPVASVSLSPDGKLLATATRTDTIQVWGTATGKIVRKITGREILAYQGIGLRHMLNSVAFSGDGKRFVTCDQTGLVEVWDVTTWKSVVSLSREGRSSTDWSLAVSEDGNWVATGGDTEIRLWDVKLGKLVFLAKIPDVKFVALSADGNTLAARGRVWHLSKIKEFYQIGVSQGLWNGTWALTDNKEGPLWMPEQGMALSNDGTLLVGQPQPAVSFTLQPQPGFSYTVAPDSFSAKTNLILQDLVTSKSIRRFYSPLYMNCLAFTPDNKWLVGGSGQTIRIWEVASGRQNVRTLYGHSHDVLSVSISADNKHFATGSADGTARLWDLTTGKQIRVFQK